MNNERDKAIAEAVIEAAARKCEQRFSWNDDRRAQAKLDANEIRSLDLDAIIASVPDPWLPIAKAPKDGTEVWAYNGEQVRMKYLRCEEWCGWIYADAFLSEADAAPEQPTHYMPLPPQPKESNEQD